MPTDRTNAICPTCGGENTMPDGILTAEWRADACEVCTRAFDVREIERGGEPWIETRGPLDPEQYREAMRRQIEQADHEGDHDLAQDLKAKLSDAEVWFTTDAYESPPVSPPIIAPPNRGNIEGESPTPKGGNCPDCGGALDLHDGDLGCPLGDAGSRPSTSQGIGRPEKLIDSNNQYRRLFVVSQNHATALSQAIIRDGHDPERPNVNEFWIALAAERGFVWTTVADLTGEFSPGGFPSGEFTFTAEVEDVLPISPAFTAWMNSTGAAIVVDGGLTQWDLALAAWDAGSRNAAMSLARMEPSVMVELPWPEKVETYRVERVTASRLYLTPRPWWQRAWDWLRDRALSLTSGFEEGGYVDDSIRVGDPVELPPLSEATISARFSDGEIAYIQRWQDCGWVHPLTCPHHSDRRLKPFKHGLRCMVPNCSYCQTWVPPEVFGPLPDSADALLWQDIRAGGTR